MVRRYTVVNARIKVSGCQKILFLYALGIAEKVTVINKECFECALCAFEEDCLPIVDMPGAYVNHPCQAEAVVVPDPREARLGDDLQQPYAIATEEARTEAQTRVWPNRPLCPFNPAGWTLIEKVIC
jgi:hypothetical protein